MKVKELILTEQTLSTRMDELQKSMKKLRGEKFTNHSTIEEWLDDVSKDERLSVRLLYNEYMAIKGEYNELMEMDVEASKQAEDYTTINGQRIRNGDYVTVHYVSIHCHDNCFRTVNETPLQGIVADANVIKDGKEFLMIKEDNGVFGHIVDKHLIHKIEKIERKEEDSVEESVF